MALSSFAQLQQHVIEKLREGLSPDLTYHCVAHTLDVLQQVENIALQEGNKKQEELLLLKVAALYHDTGFLLTYQNHEEKGCELAREELPSFGFNPNQIENICGLILATKVPQMPKTKLQQIMCDADLDYLGRADFFTIGETLFQEFLCYGIVKDEENWNQLQVKFLENHSFFTHFSRNNREPQKQVYLQQIKEKVNHH